MPNQIQQGYTFSNGQLVEAQNLTDVAKQASLLKGAISEQPNLSLPKPGTYSYISGINLNLSCPSHGFSVSDRVSIDFTSSTGAPGNFFDGVYTVSAVPSPDSFDIILSEPYSATSGVISVSLLPSPDDEILVHDVSDVTQVKPKKVAVGALLAGGVDASFSSVETDAIDAKSPNGVDIGTVDGFLVTGGSYQSQDGNTNVVTRALHGIQAGDIIEATCTSVTGGAGANYGGVVEVVLADANTFVYNLRQPQFEVIDEGTDEEADEPIQSAGAIEFKKVGRVDVSGHLRVTSDVYINGITYMKGDTFHVGKARFQQFVLPKGRTGSRPANPEEGQLFYNRDDDIVEIFRKSSQFPNGTWETFDKISNQIIIPATYSVRTRIAELADSWWSKTLWTLPEPAPYKQYEITLPPIRIQHFNDNNDATMQGKLELIAVPQEIDPVVGYQEFVIGRHVANGPHSSPFGIEHGGIVTIPAWNKILTPDNIDMSRMLLTLRVTVRQNQNPDPDNPALNSFLNSEWILPWTGFVRINPIVRKGGTAIPTPWKAVSQADSLTSITSAQRKPNAWWFRGDGVTHNANNIIPMSEQYPSDQPAEIPLASVRQFNSSYGNASQFQTTII